ncbi:MAG TPA: protein kinase [Nocardioidaceae bacterium]|nr:protein kinase [Nocardioidaceae bacterium]
MRPSERLMLSPGERIAGYLIDSYVARGGMAVVYRARDLQLGRWVAVKVMAPELAKNEKFRQRFVRESELAAAIDHPNILPIYQAGEADGLLYIAMRFVEGQDLGARLGTEGALDPYTALPIFTQVAAALDTAHAHGLVHRDVKPGNVLLSRAGSSPDGDHVYLTDFGLTKRSTSLSGFTTAGHFLGTIQYVAPEQIAAKSVDERADIYAMGCVLFEALAGVPPFQRDDDAALLWAHINDAPPSMSSLRPDLPAAIDAVFEHAMAKEPEDRPASCRAVITELRAAFRGNRAMPPAHDVTANPTPPRESTPLVETGAYASNQPTPTGDTGIPSTGAVPQQRTPASSQPTAGEPPSGADPSAPSAAEPRPNRVRRGVVIAAGAALLVMVAGAAWLVWGNRSAYTSFDAADGSFSLERPTDWAFHPGNATHGVCFCHDGLEDLFEGTSVDAWPSVRSLAKREPSAADGLYSEVTPGEHQFRVSSADDAQVLADGVNDNQLTFTGSDAVVVGGGTGYWVEGTMSNPDGGAPSLRFRYYFIDYGNGSAQMAFFALPDRFQRLRPTIDHVVDSVRFH